MNRLWIALLIALAAYFLFMRKSAPKTAFIQGTYDTQQFRQTGCQTAGNRPAVLTGFPGNYPTEACAI